jgi:hypothetical protein
VIEVQVRTPERALQVIRVAGVVVQLLIDRVVIGCVVKLEAGAHAIKQIPVLRRREIRRRCGIRIGRCRGLHLRSCAGLLCRRG